jgi:hypothetical protein
MRASWPILGLFVAIAFACGGPASGGDDTGTPTDPTGTATGSGTLTPTPSGTATTPPGPLPTLTNVPSFATWDASVRPAMPAPPANCTTCHGGAGGFTLYPTDTDPTNKKYWWFSSLCNRTNGTDRAGTQKYSGPTTGRFIDIACNKPGVTHAGGSVPTAFCTAVTNWLPEGGTHTPPLCANQYNYDLANSH